MSLPIDAQTTAQISASLESTRSADAWQRRFGVPWERVERAARAVSERAMAASRRKFAMAEAAPAQPEALRG